MGTDDIFKKRRKRKPRRPYETRMPKADSILIIAEGTKTEPLYLKPICERIVALRGGNVGVHEVNGEVYVKGVGRGTGSLLEKAKDVLSKSPYVYQHVWLVFDKDDFVDFDDAIRDARQEGFKVAWSNQSFEYWLVLHFEKCDSALSRQDWVRKLDELFEMRGVAGGYEKNRDDVYQIVTEYGQQRLAMRFAEDIRQSYGDRPPSTCDPCTTVDELVTFLNGFILEESDN